MPDRELAQLVNAYSTAVRTTRVRAAAAVRSAWLNLDAYRSPDVARFARTVVPLVEGAQLRVAALTAAYLAGYEAIMTGETYTLVGVTPADVTGLRSVPMLEVYDRPGLTVWNALSAGTPFTQAVRLGLQRAESLVATDLQLAKTHTAQRLIGERRDIAGYRRVLSGSKSCGLCIAASTQRYHRGDLLPIHPGCDCSVAPIFGTRDPGQIIDPDTLSGLHDTLAERFGDDVTRNDVRNAVVVHEHGDIGPVLSVRGQDFDSLA